MRIIAAPVRPGSAADIVRNLADGLRRLLSGQVVRVDQQDVEPYLAGLANDRTAGQYGRATTKVVAAFQEQHGLPGIGEVDEATATALNEVLRELGAFDVPDDAEWVVRGEVVGPSGPVDRLTVEVYDRDLFFGRDRPGGGQFLGAAAVSESRFEIAYTTDAFAAADIDGTPDLIVRVMRDGAAVPDVRIIRIPDGGSDLTVPADAAVTAEESVLGFPARRTELVRIELDGGEPLRSEYDRVWQGIEPLLPAGEPGADVAAREARVIEAAAQFDEASSSTSRSSSARPAWSSSRSPLWPRPPRWSSRSAATSRPLSSTGCTAAASRACAPWRRPRSPTSTPASASRRRARRSHQSSNRSGSSRRRRSTGWRRSSPSARPPRRTSRRCVRSWPGDRAHRRAGGLPPVAGGARGAAAAVLGGAPHARHVRRAGRRDPLRGGAVRPGRR